MYSDEEIRQLILEMRSEVDKVRQRAFGIIYTTTDTRFLRIALEILQEETEQAIELALNTICHLKHVNTSASLPQILPFLENSSHYETAFITISSIENAEAIPYLWRFLHDSEPEVRRLALRAISRLGNTSTVETVLYMLRDPDFEVRDYACRLLSRYPEQRIIELLLNKLKVYDELSPSAAFGLGVIGDKRFIEVLKNAVHSGDEALAYSAMDALWEIEKGNGESFFVEQALHHSYENLRYHAVNILARIPSQAVIEALIFISQNDMSYIIQQQAIDSLGNFRTPRTIEAIKHWNEHHRRKS